MERSSWGHIRLLNQADLDAARLIFSQTNMETLAARYKQAELPLQLPMNASLALVNGLRRVLKNNNLEEAQQLQLAQHWREIGY